MKKDEENIVIPGLPATEEEAISQIEEIEASPSSDWLPFESVLKKIESRYEVYAC